MEDGDLLYVEYDMWILPDDEEEEKKLFDTTDEEKAEEEEIYDEDSYYGPRPVVIGGGNLLEGFSEALMDAEVGEEDSVTIPPEKGIGKRKAEKIDLYSRRELERKDVDPVVGKEVEVDNQRGTIIQATAGRVRIDFNHPLAGKTLQYDFTITEKPEEVKDIVEGILIMDYHKADFEVEIADDEDTINITLPEECKYDQRWFVSKYRIVGDLRNHVDASSIRFIEEYVEKEEEVEEESEEEDEEAEEETEAEEDEDDEEEE